MKIDEKMLKGLKLAVDIILYILGVGCIVLFGSRFGANWKLALAGILFGISLFEIVYATARKTFDQYESYYFTFARFLIPLMVSMCMVAFAMA